MNKKEFLIYGIYVAGFIFATFHGIIGVIGLFIIIINAIVHLLIADKLYNKEKNPQLSIYSYLFTYVYTFNIIVAMFLFRGWRYDSLILIGLIISLLAIFFPFNLVVKDVNARKFFYRAKIKTYIFLQFSISVLFFLISTASNKG